ncbi:hypothetical protein D9758_011124 [Tetrapyrgos nigripes]|uniref:Serine carboxypeptidase n=1 Tax=Tetrapyrgos nigripes TaxID=182062 RepID=A0A8H5FNK1_9AGAR|nr:hypothetical protein D9758_011124 [Tetrapyrgos nigripes]
MSGYIDVGKNMSMWFWFFEARESPETAPFTLWLNGGPGCSSMIGLFQGSAICNPYYIPFSYDHNLMTEHGPCLVNDDLTTTLNPFSWNNISNMIYIDQPIGTGFSFGTDTRQYHRRWSTLRLDCLPGSSLRLKATEDIMDQVLSHSLTSRTRRFRKARFKGEEINVSALMINNGWFDPLIQNKAYLDFATNAPGYGQLQSDEVLAAMNDSYFRPGGCLDQEQACYDAGTGPESDKVCRDADDFCIEFLLVPAAIDRDIDDLRAKLFCVVPFGSLCHFPSSASYYGCYRTGDDARTQLPKLGALANSRLKMLVWAGDADINCNWLGGHASVLAMDWYGKERLANTPFTNMTIDGKAVAAIQNVDNFSFARVYEAGHEVPAFQPEAALEIFRQILNMQQLHSV